MHVVYMSHRSNKIITIKYQFLNYRQNIFFFFNTIIRNIYRKEVKQKYKNVFESCATDFTAYFCTIDFEISA